MPVRGNTGSKARLVDAGCIRRHGMQRVTKRYPHNGLKDALLENVGVYAKEQCFIPAGTGKYIPVQTN